MMKTILLTGFEPFGGECVNPSQITVQSLRAKRFGGINLVTSILPVSRFAATQQLDTLINETKPDVVMMLGEAGTRARISPERVAINVDDYRMPDNSANQPKDEAIIADAPTAYFSTLPIRAMVKAMTDADIPAAISNSAGTYLCNRVFYWALHYINTHNLPIKAGFIHLPYLHEQTINKRDCPSLSRETMIEGIRLSLLACV
jgi:pyroglutamyl-peptidase